MQGRSVCRAAGNQTAALCCWRYFWSSPSRTSFVNREGPSSRLSSGAIGFRAAGTRQRAYAARGIFGGASRTSFVDRAGPRIGSSQRADACLRSSFANASQARYRAPRPASISALPSILATGEGPYRRQVHEQRQTRIGGRERPHPPSARYVSARIPARAFRAPRDGPGARWRRARWRGSAFHPRLNGRQPVDLRQDLGELATGSFDQAQFPPRCRASSSGSGASPWPARVVGHQVQHAS